MLSTILSLVRLLPEATWMTIGDGRYGSDAFFLQEHGADVVATSLTDTTLRTAYQKGYINKFKMENAEHISASDSSYDFVLCKESYHHFPRPPIAYYEMLRVAKKAVILIEPIEDKGRVFDTLKQVAKKILRGDKIFSFEPSGNFVYRVNIREIEKMLTALDGSCIAIKKFNDFYYPRVAHHKNCVLSLGTIITRIAILLQDLFCYLPLMNYGLATIIAFKSDITSEMGRKLKKNGFNVISLPKNPYFMKETCA